MKNYSGLAVTQLIAWHLMEKYNIDPQDVFIQSGLDPRLMHREGGRYTQEQIIALWDEMERRIPDPCFGLLGAECFHPAYAGTLGFALLMSRSLRDMFERLVRFSTILGRENSTSLTENVETNSLTLHFSYVEKKTRSIGREASLLSIAFAIMKLNFRNKLNPVSVNFTHPQQDCEERYFEVFECKTTFNNSHPSIEIRCEDADKPLIGGTSELVAKSDKVLALSLVDQKGEKPSIIQKTNEIIIENLPSGSVNIDTVAIELGVSSKTLQRRLAEEGTTFTQVLSTVKQDLACTYLEKEDHDFSEITFLLGFSEQSAFSRSFKKWTGESPTAYRRRHRM